jgi:colanic acid/amylovoran biosynthesis protein
MSKNKFVLITGVEFTNQGAFLMMRAAMQEVRERLGAVPVLDYRVGTAEEREAVGARTFVPVRLERVAGLPGIGPAMSTATQWIHPRQLTAVLDASGYRYGDAWTSLDLNSSVLRYRRFADLNIPVYVLPQALGPFEETRSVAVSILGTSRLVFARDPDSYRAIVDVAPASALDRLRQSPDFTGGVKGAEPVPSWAEAGNAPLVPNWNIAERAQSVAARDQYIQNLADLAVELHRRGFAPYGLSHEGARDTRLLHEVRERVDEVDFPVVGGFNGLELKWIIGRSGILVSGRYHALASALSQDVPVVAHGWSHKYRWLLEEHGCASTLVDPYSPRGSQFAALDRALSMDRATISAGADDYREANRRMWDSISADLEMVQTG